MKIRPSVKGFFVKRYAIVGIVALIVGIASSAILAGMGMAIVSVGVMGLVALFIAGGLLHSVLHNKNTSMYISDDNVVYEKGILSHHKIKIPMYMVTDSTIQRSFFDKLIGVSTLMMNTSGTAEREIIATDFGYADVEKMNEYIHSLIRGIPHAKRKNEEFVPYTGEEENK